MLQTLYSMLYNFLTSQFSFLLSLAAAAALAVLTALLHRRLADAVFRLLRRLHARARGRLPEEKRKDDGFFPFFLDAAQRPAQLLLLAGGLYLAAAALRFPSERFDAAWHVSALGLLRLAVILLAAFTVARLCTPEAAALLLPSRSADAMGRTFCVFAARILRLLVGAFGAVILISELGYDVGGLIAGIGLGGLTLALAAQDWASNLFGGLVILFDKPFAVGDWIAVESSMEGIVEDMTFRTTRIRSFDNSQIVVPNALLVSKPVTNWSRMEKRKISFDIGLTYDSPPDRLAECAERIGALLRGDEAVNQEVISVTFSEFGDSALLLRVHCFTDLTGYADYMKVRERLNYGILDTVASLELSFAYPTVTVVGPEA